MPRTRTSAARLTALGMRNAHALKNFWCIYRNFQIPKKERTNVRSLRGQAHVRLSEVWRLKASTVLCFSVLKKGYAMDLFEYQYKKHVEKESPLSARMRPSRIEDFVGQEHILGKNTLLYRAIKADKLTSVILHGPPGTGKTTIARIIANTTNSNFVNVNATSAGAKDLREIIENAKMNISSKRTILFIDEIHRFNKSQQDILLPYVENGTIILIGATTENPYFEVNKALISRSTVFSLEALSTENIKDILMNAARNKEKGIGMYKPMVDDDAIIFLSDMANGDARVALNALELAILTTETSENGTVHITKDVVKECIQKRALNYDKNGDNHYNIISAFIKSMRGSDPDAAIYYLGRMLYAGEDPKFIARRLVVFASEDVGNADPVALQIATSAAQATDFVGMPECRIILSQAVAYVASAPKSNASYTAINRVMEDVATIKIKDIPSYLKDSHSGTKTTGYKYPHDYVNNYVEQQYLPDELVGKKYYNPTDNGAEKQIKDRLEKLRR